MNTQIAPFTCILSVLVASCDALVPYVCTLRGKAWREEIVTELEDTILRSYYCI